MQAARTRHEPADRIAWPATGRAVLVVEDDPGLRALFKELLTDLGYAVEAAEDGRVGLDRLQSSRPDLILLDMMMPVMDGRAFRAAQLANPAWRHIPVIVVSATSEFLREDETLGAKAILRKPFDFDELMELVETWSGPSGSDRALGQ